MLISDWSSDVFSSDLLTVTDSAGGVITIKNYSKADSTLGISLTDEDDDDSGNEERPNLDEAESRTSPIVIDLDGDGVETRAYSRDRYFDHDGNGMRASTAWIGADDGFLFRELNKDGANTTGTDKSGRKKRRQKGTQ